MRHLDSVTLYEDGQPRNQQHLYRSTPFLGECDQGFKWRFSQNMFGPQHAICTMPSDISSQSMAGLALVIALLLAVASLCTVRHTMQLSEGTRGLWPLSKILQSFKVNNKTVDVPMSLSQNKQANRVWLYL